MGSTLVGEGEGVVSQGESLMLKQRDEERKAGTGEIRVEPTVDTLDAALFSHSILAYQVMAEQSNVYTEETLGLLHTSEALERAQLAHAAVPKGMLTTQGDSESDDPIGDDDNADMEDDASGPSKVQD